MNRRIIIRTIFIIIVSAVIAAHGAAAQTWRDGAAAVAHDALFFTELPHVESLSAAGEAVIAWRTKTETPPAIVYYGPAMPGAPRFREEAREQAAATDTHRVILDLGKLMTEKKDYGNWRAGGQGTAVFRVENFDPGKQRSQVWDGRFCFTREGDFTRAPCVVPGPFVSNVTARGAVVWFETDIPTAAAVEVAAGAGNPLRFVSGKAATRHEILVSGLEPGRRYPYAVVLTGADGAPLRGETYTLETAPEPGGVFRFAVIGDSRGALGGPEFGSGGVNASTLRDIIFRASADEPKFIMFTGDLIDGYTSLAADFDNQIRTWLKVVEPAGRFMPIYAAMGNHESLQTWYADGVFSDGAGGETSESAFARMLVFPQNAPPPESADAPSYTENVYSFDYGSSHFVVINTDYWYTQRPDLVAGNLRGNIMAGQLDWLERDLETARANGAQRIFIFGHEPAFPNGGHVEDAMWYKGEKPDINAMRDRFWKILTANSVTAAFFSHEHSYSRTLIDASVNHEYTHPVWQIITGGGGGAYYIRDTSVPWASAVKAFSALEHYALITVREDTGSVQFLVVSPTGQVLDEGEF